MVISAGKQNRGAVSHNNCSLAGCFGEWRAPASVTSPAWRNPIHRNPFLIINQIHRYAQMTHTFFVTYECTKLLCVSLTRFYLDSFSFKENTYPVLNQRHISVDIRTAPFFTGANHARSRFSKPTLPQRAACCILSQVTFLLSPPGRQVSQGSRSFCLIPRYTFNKQRLDGGHQYGEVIARLL